MRRLFVLLGVLLACAGPAQAERVVSQISNDTIEITSSFAGERMSMFGTVIPDAGAAEGVVPGPLNVIIVVIGPTQERIARQKTNNFGIWLNTRQAEFDNFPSYFHVLSSGRLTDITDPVTLTENFILPESHTLPSAPDQYWDDTVFGPQLVRMMTEEGLFGVQENGVNFLTTDFYSARLTLPSNAPPGPYIALTYVFRDGQIIARQSQGFAVRKIGFERFLAISAVQQPLAYGVVCVILALFTGWLGGVIFRR
jgi:uncharacterized protein (TIGR02186 family)